MIEPGPDHPITITRHPRPVRVKLNGALVAETSAALALKEASYPVVFYIPRADIRAELFSTSERRSVCPYKGTASYYHLSLGDVRKADAAWSYETLHPAVAAIAGHLAFYPDRVDAIEEG